MPLHRDNLFFGLAATMTAEQRTYVDSIMDNKVTFVNAKAGTGKTTLAVGVAKIIGKPLVYIFSPVDEHIMGFRPGVNETKEAAYLAPLTDALLEIGEDPLKVIYDAERPELMKRGNVWVYPTSHAFKRGVNLKNKTVIIDESQNFTRTELKKILSRIHDSCTVIVIGHDGQCDLKNPKLSGFVPYIRLFKDEDYVGVCELTKNFRGRISQKADEMTESF